MGLRTVGVGCRYKCRGAGDSSADESIIGDCAALVVFVIVKAVRAQRKTYNSISSVPSAIRISAEGILVLLEVAFKRLPLQTDHILLNESQEPLNDLASTKTSGCNTIPTHKIDKTQITEERDKALFIDHPRSEMPTPTRKPTPTPKTPTTPTIHRRLRRVDRNGLDLLFLRRE